MATLQGRTLLISGATRGIGLAIALRAAKDGARIAVLGKTKEPHPRLPGTIDTACEAIRQAGGEALGILTDIRDDEQVDQAVAQTVEAFGGIDILVNNASAIFLADSVSTPMKRFDLMHGVNARGSYTCGRACLPHLAKSSNPHILTLSPPLDLQPHYFSPHLAYSMAKFGMSLCTLGWAAELRGKKIAANSLWPRTVIDTAAVRNLLGGESVARQGRHPAIVADAAYQILTSDSATCTGHFFVDEELLRERGVSDFEQYAVTPGETLLTDLFLPVDES